MTDIIIIGGGIVGLATALQIKRQRPGLSVTVIEKENRLAAHQTGHNSGVIHSGLYYKPGSLKATNCIRGYWMLLEFCEQENVPYELCGKIVVATKPEEMPLLDNLYQRGQQNGLEGLKKLTFPKCTRSNRTSGVLKACGCRKPALSTMCRCARNTPKSCANWAERFGWARK
jgi:L-2-hydroxyglutarate oxidase